MRYWLTARDGSVSYQCDARNTTEAFELLAKHLRYESWAAFCEDLVYSYSDFTVATIQHQPAEFDEYGDRINVKRQQAEAELGAFKFLRRLGRG